MAFSISCKKTSQKTLLINGIFDSHKIIAYRRCKHLFCDTGNFSNRNHYIKMPITKAIANTIYNVIEKGHPNQYAQERAPDATRKEKLWDFIKIASELKFSVI